LRKLLSGKITSIKERNGELSTVKETWPGGPSFHSSENAEARRRAGFVEGCVCDMP